jgi:c-di-GMP-binding flagellar brake protein YcgR
MTMRKERRQSRRVETDLELTVAGLDRTATVARALNLSAGGAYFIVERGLAPLSKLQLALELPALPMGKGSGSPELLDVEAVVVRSEPDASAEGCYRVGVAFMNMSPASRKRLEDYIEWRMTRSLLESAESAGIE